MSEVLTPPVPGVRETPPSAAYSARWRYGCYAALLIVLVVLAAIRFHVRNMPLERDEGEYAYSGQLMLQGIPPYKLASNMKLPGTYVAYALLMAVFGQTAAGIHIGMILVTTAASILIFLLGKYLYGPLAGTIAGSVYVFLSARPAVLGIDGHATHFVVLMAFAGILLLLYAMEHKKTWLFFASGFSFGLAFLMKQPGILLAAFAGLYWLYCEWKSPIEWKKLALRGGAFAGGIALPYAFTCLWMLRAGVFSNFWFWTWTYAREYGLENNLSQGWQLLTLSFWWAVRPFAIWEIVMLGLFAPLWSRQARAHGGFICGLFVTSCLTVSAGLYFRPHYYILLLPAAALCVGIAVECAQRELRRLNLRRWAYLPLLYFAVIYGIAVHGQWHAFFRLDPEALSRKIHYDQPYVDAKTVADFIHAHSSPRDQIGIIGSEPEVCFYTRLHCASSYLYVFPLMEKQRFAQPMQEEFMRQLRDARPRFLIYVDDERSWGWKATIDENRPFFDQAWAFAHTGYELVYQVSAPLSAHIPQRFGGPEWLWNEGPQLYVFERKS